MACHLSNVWRKSERVGSSTPELVLVLSDVGKIKRAKITIVDDLQNSDKGVQAYREVKGCEDCSAY